MVGGQEVVDTAATDDGTVNQAPFLVGMLLLGGALAVALFVVDKFSGCHPGGSLEPSARLLREQVPGEGARKHQCH